jgi:hypothetical protein
MMLRIAANYDWLAGKAGRGASQDSIMFKMAEERPEAAPQD